MQRLEVRAKVEHTNLERYGVKHAAQNEQIKAETRDYFLEKYGVTSPLRSPEIQQRIRDYNTEKYGVKYSAQSEEFQTKMREGVFRKYGVSCVYKLPEIQQKIKNTLLAKYGVEHPLQHPGFFAKFQKTCKKYKDIEVEGRTLRLQGYEGQALKWLLEERGIPISSIVASLDDKNLLRVSYMKEGKPSVYYPDFLINEADIYEVKSTFTLYANVRIYKELVSKALSCLNQGFSFTLLLVIIENKITRVIEMPSDWYTLEYVDSLQYLLTTRSISFKISPKLLDFKP